MRSLRDLIENQEQKEIVYEEVEVEVENITATKNKIEEYKQYASNSELTFPEIYINKELYDLALRINDSFMTKLKSDQKSCD